jgi:hypothetical protein
MEEDGGLRQAVLALAIDGPPTALATISLLVAALLAVTSVAGLLFGEQGLYEADLETLPALIGQDVLWLLFGLPLLLGSAWWAWRGSLAGRRRAVLRAYSHLFHALWPVFNPLYVAYLALVGLSLYGASKGLLSLPVG